MPRRDAAWSGRCDIEVTGFGGVHGQGFTAAEDAPMRPLLPIRWWSGGAVAGHRRRDWEAVGVASFGELRTWARLATCSPARVSAWRQAGIGPIEAKGFEERKIEPNEVATWRQAVSSFDELDSWARLGIRDVSTIHAWKATTEGITDVVAWQRLGVYPHQVPALRDAGVDPSERRAWLRIGIREPAVIARWTAAGFDPALAAPWSAAAVAPEIAAVWVAAGFDERSSRGWRKTGWEPEPAAAWKRQGVSARAAVRWRAAGIPDADGPIWSAAGVARRTAAGLHAAGTPPPIGRPSQTWSSQGPGPEKHAAAGNDDALLTDGAGADVTWPPPVEPPQAEPPPMEPPQAELPPVEPPPGLDPPEPQVAETASEVADGALPEPPSDSGSISATEEAALHPSQADPAPTLDPPAPVEAQPDPAPTVPADWSAAGLDQRAWEKWRDDFDDPERVAALIDARIGLAAARWWRSCGIEDPTQINRLRKAKIDPDTVKAWATLGVSRPSDILTWNRRWAPAVAARWSDATGGSVQDAWRWAATVDSPDHAERWIALGFRTVAWIEHVIKLVGPPSLSSLLALEGLARAGVGHPDAMQRWVEVSSLEEIERWVAIGVVDLEQVAAWSRASIELDSAERWTAMGVALKEARRWLDVGLEADAARPWCEALATPAEARRWLEAGVASAEAIVWLTSGVERPDRAAELATIGFSATSYAEATTGKDSTEIHRAIRAQAIRAAGLDLEQDVATLAFDESSDEPEQALLTVATVAAALAGSGEERLRVVHGSPHLSLAGMRAVPGARYVRGRLKVRLFEALSTGELFGLGAPLVSEGPTDDPGAETDGASTVLRLRPAETPDEYLRLPAGEVVR